MPILVQGETLSECCLFETWRAGRFLAALLRVPHRVLSTSTVNGGQVEHVRCLLNHQSCEGSGHLARHELIREVGYDAYHVQVCEESGVPPESTAMMGTAANMNYAALVRRDYDDLSVTAIVTAGTQGNAVCAGDPSNWVESADGWKKISPPPPPVYEGTINTILLLGSPVTAPALARAVITMTEAKTAALHQLAISSRYSQDAATGTGTDQYCVAAPLANGGFELTSTSQHSKLGELIGVAVRDATLEALRWQNGLEPSYTRSLFHALGRFGCTEESLLSSLAEMLSADDFDLLKRNSKSVFYEPAVAAASYALAAAWDRVRYGTVSAALGADVLRQQAACLAASLAARPDRWFEYWQQLTFDADTPMSLVPRAVALGWSTKWT